MPISSAVPSICSISILVVGLISAVARGDLNPWSFSATASVRETYDDNVYLQDITPLAKQRSMVTTAAVTLGASYSARGDWDTALALGVTPQYTWYHSASSEDFASISGTANLTARKQNWLIEMNNAITEVDGDDRGLVFTGPGGAPAIGGIPIRDRRDASIFRAMYRLTWTSGPWMVRPVFNAYIHDFHTDHLATPGYLNYVDRNDFNAGVDLGYRVLKNTHLLLGYRFGHQEEPPLLTSPVEYSNSYHRILVGVEGKPVEWIKVSVLVGPDFRNFGPNTAPGFERNDIKVWADASITFYPTTQDELAFLVRRYEQPSYGGRAVYEDITYQVAYKHKFNDFVQAQAMLQAYGGEWLAPVSRDDYIYTLNLALVFKVNQKLSGEVGWSLDRAESKLPSTDGREFTRHLLWASLKWAF